MQPVAGERWPGGGLSVEAPLPCSQDAYSTSMSSLWTPSGEHFPKEEGTDAAPPPFTAPGDSDVTGPSQADAQAEVDAMRAQLANTPAEVVVANHCYGLFEL